MQTYTEIYRNSPIEFSGKPDHLQLQEMVVLCELLDFDLIDLDQTKRQRVLQYYLPVLQWVITQYKIHENRYHDALLVGISAPQGSGKSTLVGTLQKALTKLGYPAVDISIDDFYLKRSEHEELNKQYPDNELYKVRGNAGTHDVNLGYDVISELKKSQDGVVSVPRYNKAAFGGKGDRCPREEWNKVQRPLKIILLEGWMLGFTQLDEATLEKSGNKDLRTINEKLPLYNPINDLVDSWLVVKVQDFNWVFEWRAEAEVKMRQSGRGGMSDEQVKDFVSKYMPAYQAYLPKIYEQGPPLNKEKDETLTHDSVLVLEIDKNRAPVSEYYINKERQEN